MTAADLTAAYPVSDTDLDRLRSRLVAEATDRDLLDVGYRTVDSPVGPLLLAATGLGLVRVAFASEGPDAVLQELADRISPRVLAAPGRLDEVCPAVGRLLRRPPAPVRAAVGLAALAGFPAYRARPPGHRHRLRTDRQLPRTRHPGGQPERGARGRHRLRDQPDSGGGAVPPGDPVGRHDGRLPGRPGGQTCLADLEVRIDQSAQGEYGLPSPFGPSRT